MGKEKFVYNKQTLQYERHVLTVRDYVLKGFKYLSTTLVGSVVLISIIYTYFPSPREQKLIDEIQTLESQYDEMLKDVEQLSAELNQVQEHDAKIHRIVFGMDPIPQKVWDGTGINVEATANDRLKHLGLSKYTVTQLRDKIFKLKGQLALQKASLDSISLVANSKEKMMASIPSIKPVREDKLNRSISLLSGFGYRIHPIHKVRKFHSGIDFAAPKGTHIQATGDGKVIEVEYSHGGYGNKVVIDHGYGYKTLYAHMSEIDVRVGMTVKKGQKIGTIGSTGTSTAPHLHYEVHVRNEPVNPIQFCMDGLSVQEYQELVNMADKANQSFD